MTFETNKKNSRFSSTRDANSTWDGDCEVCSVCRRHIDDIFLTDDFIALYLNWFIFLMVKFSQLQK